MLIFEMDDEIEDLMAECKIKTLNIEPKKTGQMFVFEVDDGKSLRIMRVLFIDMKITEPDYDFEDSFLRDLKVFGARQAYGSTYFIGSSAKINKNKESVMLERVMITGSRP